MTRLPFTLALACSLAASCTESKPAEPTPAPTPKPDPTEEDAVQQAPSPPPPTDGWRRPAPAATRADAAAMKRATFAGLDGALALHRTIAKPDAGNVVWSPFSLRAAMSMTYVGAREETAQEIARALRFPEGVSDTAAVYARLFDELAPGEAAHQLRVANRLFVEKTYALLPSFTLPVTESWAAQPETLDFKSAPEPARAHINQWALDRTGGHIKDLLPPRSIDGSTSLVLGNAVWFKGTWKEEFDEASTRDAPFTKLDGSVKQVPTMWRAGDYAFAENETVSLARLPYQGDETAMYVLLPKAKDGLLKLERSLDTATLATLISSATPRKLALLLPRYRLDWGDEMSGPLKELGIKAAFQGGANFSGLSEANDLYISAVFHKAFVEVNEEGSEAAAATAVVMTRGGGGPTPQLFAVDHPFLFLIRHEKTGEVLFLGRVTDPG